MSNLNINKNGVLNYSVCQFTKVPILKFDIVSKECGFYI